MSRIALTCGCGWNFFIPGSTPGLEAACPSCSRPVTIPGRKPGMEFPLTPGEIAARVQKRGAVIRFFVLLGLAGAAAAGFLAWRDGRVGETEPETPVRADQLPGTDPSRRTAREPFLPLPPLPGSASVPPAQVDERRRRIHEHVRMVNLASILSECLRYRNLAREWSQIQADVAVYEQRILADLKELAAVGEKVLLDARFAEGDRIVAFGEKDLTRLKRAEAAQVLHGWMNAWRPGPALTQVHVLRDGHKLTIYLQFPEETKELLLLLRHPYLQRAPVPDRDPSLAEPTLPVPAPESVARTVEAMAKDVVAQSDAFGDIVLEMRQRTDSLRTTTVPVWPDKSARGIVLIDDPLTFNPGALTGGAAAEIGRWWNTLERQDRMEFATYFGLWCAYARSQPPKK